ncbi:MAG: hypothetical protein ACI9W6_001960 [Motiliproteus sp.]|jgi:hypothetical protein
MRYAGFWLLMLGLSGCAGTPFPSAEVRQSKGTPVLALSTPQPESPVNSIKQPVSRADRARITSILELLARADRAVMNKRLAEPRGDNAADYYHQVLRLQPGYEEALAGLDNIVDRYLQYRVAAQRQGNQERARHYLALARRVDPDSVKVKQASAGRQSDAKVPARAPVNYIRLDAHQLKRKSSELLRVLGALADQIKAEDARVTIDAPTDSQGRWIYLQLNQRHEDYRIRANLRLEKQPGVRLLD